MTRGAILLAFAVLETAHAGGLPLGTQPQLRPPVYAMPKVSTQQLPLMQNIPKAQPRSSFDGGYMASPRSSFDGGYSPRYGQATAQTSSKQVSQPRPVAQSDSSSFGAAPRSSFSTSPRSSMSGSARPRASFDGAYSKSYAPEYGGATAGSSWGASSSDSSISSIFDSISSPKSSAPEPVSRPRESFSGSARPRSSFDGAYSKAYAPEFGGGAPSSGSSWDAISSSPAASSAAAPRASMSGGARPRASFDGAYSKAYSPEYGANPMAQASGSSSPKRVVTPVVKDSDSISTIFDSVVTPPKPVSSPRASSSGSARPRASFDGAYSKAYSPEYGDSRAASASVADNSATSNFAVGPRSDFQASPRASFDGSYQKSYASEYAATPQLSALEQQSNYFGPAMLAFTSLMLASMGVKKYRSSSNPQQMTQEALMV